MKNLKKFIVEQSNATTKETFITKLVSQIEIDLGPVLGKKVKKETMYISTAKQAGTGVELELDMNMFNVVERPFDHPESGEIMLKWLHLK